MTQRRKRVGTQDGPSNGRSAVFQRFVTKDEGRAIIKSASSVRILIVISCNTQLVRAAKILQMGFELSVALNGHNLEDSQQKDALRYK